MAVRNVGMLKHFNFPLSTNPSLSAKKQGRFHKVYNTNKAWLTPVQFTQLQA